MFEPSGGKQCTWLWVKVTTQQCLPISTHNKLYLYLDFYSRGSFIHLTLVYSSQCTLWQSDIHTIWATVYLNCFAFLMMYIEYILLLGQSTNSNTRRTHSPYVPAREKAWADPEKHLLLLWAPCLGFLYLERAGNLKDVSNDAVSHFTGEMRCCVASSACCSLDTRIHFNSPPPPTIM